MAEKKTTKAKATSKAATKPAAPKPRKRAPKAPVPIYQFSAHDLAVYLRWAQCDTMTESRILDYFWHQKAERLAVQGRDYMQFRTAMNEQLYYLWQRGFWGEHGDMTLAADARNFPPQYLLAKEAPLEQYMRCLIILLIEREDLPEINIDLEWTFQHCGLGKASAVFYKRFAQLIEGLGAELRGEEGKKLKSPQMAGRRYVRLALTEHKA